ncbi:MerR family transcriptional regulator [Psychrobacillus sp. INOP01]|uniref:MerR family transcriptional regulator n=1 Tax=Psychrobacillus sp. INOP01 TaxID=2829187 RepID=UPI001BAADA78|nr:MerR family transcriptional regulator [Psychrobacillus sp. INOP01]QUG40760.1 MerR family transcriptional regulator [Psychrobacillus sp. INOP01]
MKSISDVAKEFNVTTRTIRYYEELGLLRPVRSDSNRRYYRAADCAKLKLIQRGKQYGFQLDEIKEMVLLFDMDRTGRRQLERTIEYGNEKTKEIEKKIKELEEMKREMETLLHVFTDKLENLKGEENR